MGSQAEHPVNVDSKSYKITQENMNNPDRYQPINIIIFVFGSRTIMVDFLTKYHCYLIYIRYFFLLDGHLTSPAPISSIWWPVTATRGQSISRIIRPDKVVFSSYLGTSDPRITKTWLRLLRRKLENHLRSRSCLLPSRWRWSPYRVGSSSNVCT